MAQEARSFGGWCAPSEQRYLVTLYLAPQGGAYHKMQSGVHCATLRVPDMKALENKLPYWKQTYPTTP